MFDKNSRKFGGVLGDGPKKFAKNFYEKLKVKFFYNQ